MSHLPLVREKLLVKVKPPVMEKPQVKVTLPGMVRPPGSVKRPETEKLQVILWHSSCRHQILPPPKLQHLPDARGLHRKHTDRDFSIRLLDHNYYHCRFHFEQQLLG